MIVKSKEETNGNYETCFQNGKPIFDSFINKLNPLDSEWNTKKTAEWAYYKSNKQMRYNKFYKENKYKEIYFRRKLEMNSVESFDSLAKIIIDEFKKIDNHFQDQMKNGIEAWYAKNSKQI